MKKQTTSPAKVAAKIDFHSDKKISDNTDS